MYIDLLLHHVIVRVLLNTSLDTSRVNPEFATWWQSTSTHSIYRDVNTITIETVRKGLLMRIHCYVIDSQENFIELGTDFITTIGFFFTLEGVSIDSEHSPVLSSTYLFEYVCNVRNRGRDFKKLFEP